MSHIPDQFDGWTAQVYRHVDPLFRLALLVESDTAAAEGLVQRAFEWMAAGEPSPEAHLLRPLLERRAARPWRMTFGPADAARAGLTQEQAGALAALLARLTPPERLVLGLHTLRGHDAAAIAALLPALPAPPHQTLGGFRCEAVRAIGLLPPDADTALLPALDRWLDGRSSPEEVLELRRAVLEQPGARAQRDALAAVRQKLAQALPALVPGGAPASLIDDLLSMDEQPRARPGRSLRLTPALLGLVVVVLALVGAIVAVPVWMHGGQSGAAPAPLDTAAILERAARRFEQAPLQQGVLHERLQIESDGSAYTIERWYDYAAPHRLAISIQSDNRRPQATVSTDGRSLIQYRNWESGDVDLSVTPRQADAAVPLLRSFPSPAVVFGDTRSTDSGPVYLSQARAAQVSSLGQTSYQGRPAFLLTYRSASSASPPTAGQPGRVLLTIDVQTYSLLDVALFADSDSESVAQHPLRAEVLEVLDEVPDSRFTQPAADAISRPGLTSVYFPSLPPEISLALEAAGRLDSGLLVPQELPDPTMRGLVLRSQGGDDQPDIVLYYEGEFSSLALLSGQGFFARDSLDTAEEERTAGGYRYRLVHNRNGSPSAVMAEIYQPGQPERRLMLILADSYATEAEREAELERVVASLTPLTPQNVAALQERFAASGSAE